MRYIKSILITFIAIASFLAIASLAQSRGNQTVKVMDHRFYKEILFPGYEKLNAVWDVHA